MPLQATSGAASQDAFGGNGVAVVPNYIEDVFSTYLYTGNGSTQTITNGIDLAGKGGMVWLKPRSESYSHKVYDTVRGGNSRLFTNNSDGAGTGYITSFNSNGFSKNYDLGENTLDQTYVSWTFREQAKFFDVVTWTGTGGSRTITTALNGTTGCIILKRTDTADQWWVVHRSGANGFDSYGILNQTAAFTATGSGISSVTNTSFDVTSYYNGSGSTWVAYIFAHDAGGFGLTGTDNVISCGSFTTDGSANATVDLGFEPQWVMAKRSSGTGGWCIQDNMRGFTAKPTTYPANPILFANSSDAEITGGANTLQMTATGFTTDNVSYNASSTYIYIAIRRGPMKVPTTGTSVFAPITYTGTNVDNRLVNTGIVTDMTMARIRTATSAGGFYMADRLRGNGFFGTDATDEELTDADSFMTPTVGYGNSFSAMNGFGVGNDATRQLNQSSTAQLAYAFRRAPGFFDEVCWTGDGTQNRAIAHNLNAAPELIITKTRNSNSFSWFTYTAPTGLGGSVFINNTSELNTGAGALAWGSTAFNSSNFYISGSTAGYGGINGSGTTYVGYLFATLAGVSKVGSYTGTGTTQTIDCGFTGGARFVLIKRTDSTGDWYVWDTARGIIAGNDPYLLLSSTAAEVTSTDYVDTYSAGFEISSTAPAAINASGGTFIFLAIA